MPTVLIVDDSLVVRHALTARLTADGHVVVEQTSVASGKTASVDGVACAVLDLELGDGDGLEVAVALRAFAPHLPIAFFTGATTSPLALRAKEHGPVFAKPDDLDRVAAWVREATGGD